MIGIRIAVIYTHNYRLSIVPIIKMLERGHGSSGCEKYIKERDDSCP